MKAIHTDQAPAAIGPYSQAVVSGNLVFTSGQIPLNIDGDIIKGGIEEQTHQVLKNLQSVLEQAGSSLNQVVKTTVFINNMDHFQDMNEVYAHYFNEHKPARSCVEVSKLPKGVLVEIEAVGLIGH